jgi:hypothetical protein
VNGNYVRYWLLRNGTTVLEPFMNAISVRLVCCFSWSPAGCLSLRLAGLRFLLRTPAVQSRIFLTSTHSSPEITLTNSPINFNGLRGLWNQKRNDPTPIIPQGHCFFPLLDLHSCKSEVSSGRSMHLYKSLWKLKLNECSLVHTVVWEFFLNMEAVLFCTSLYNLQPGVDELASGDWREGEALFPL